MVLYKIIIIIIHNDNNNNKCLIIRESHYAYNKEARYHYGDYVISTICIKYY